MSLQRVFESARKMGVPVIITDPAGREPMVVLPLEQFEAMTGEPKSEAQKVSAVAQEPSVTPMQNVQRNDGFVSARSLVEEFKLHTAKKEDAQPRSVDLPFESELPIEERFFLEPEGEN